MPIVCFTYKLNTGVSPEQYETWVTQFDYLRVDQIPSVRSQNMYRVTKNMAGAGAIPYDYLEIIEVDDFDAFIHDLRTHPAAAEISEQVNKLVTTITSTDGILIPRAPRI